MKALGALGPLGLLIPKRDQTYASCRTDGVGDYFLENHFFGNWMSLDAAVPRTYIINIRIVNLPTIGPNTTRSIFNWFDPNKASAGGGQLFRGMRFQYQRDIAQGNAFVVIHNDTTAKVAETRVILSDSGVQQGEWNQFCIVYDPELVSSTKPGTEIFINGVKPTQTITKSVLLNTDELSHNQPMSIAAQIIDEQPPRTISFYLNGSYDSFWIFEKNRFSANDALEFYEGGGKIAQSLRSQHNLGHFNKFDTQSTFLGTGPVIKTHQSSPIRDANAKIIFIPIRGTLTNIPNDRQEIYQRKYLTT